MTQHDLPALYATAGQASTEAQNRYLLSIAFEYALLTLAGAMSLDWWSSRIYQIGYVTVFVAALCIMCARAYLKPEQQWYKARALAESIKTVTWKYVMRSDPFDKDDAISTALFRTRLSEILEDSRHIGGLLARDEANNEQITPEMRRIRGLSLEGRKNAYKMSRIDDQQRWYAKKASANRVAAKRWWAVATTLYGVCILIPLFRIANPEDLRLKSEPFIVGAASVVGWIQIKRFSELASSYALTAHEISIIKMGYEEVADERALSKFVTDAELAFSREHTQWVARR